MTGFPRGKRLIAAASHLCLRHRVLLARGYDALSVGGVAMPDMFLGRGRVFEAWVFDDLVRAGLQRFSSEKALLDAFPLKPGLYADLFFGLNPAQARWVHPDLDPLDVALLRPDLFEIVSCPAASLQPDGRSFSVDPLTHLGIRLCEVKSSSSREEHFLELTLYARSLAAVLPPGIVVVPQVGVLSPDSLMRSDFSSFDSMVEWRDLSPDGRLDEAVIQLFQARAFEGDDLPCTVSAACRRCPFLGARRHTAPFGPPWPVAVDTLTDAAVLPCVALFLPQDWLVVYGQDQEDLPALLEGKPLSLSLPVMMPSAPQGEYAGKRRATLHLVLHGDVSYPDHSVLPGALWAFEMTLSGLSGPPLRAWGTLSAVSVEGQTHLAAVFWLALAAFLAQAQPDAVALDLWSEAELLLLEHLFSYMRGDPLAHLHAFSESHAFPWVPLAASFLPAAASLVASWVGILADRQGVTVLERVARSAALWPEQVTPLAIADALLRVDLPAQAWWKHERFGLFQDLVTRLHLHEDAGRTRASRLSRASLQALWLPGEAALDTQAVMDQVSRFDALRLQVWLHDALRSWLRSQERLLYSSVSSLRFDFPAEWTDDLPLLWQLDRKAMSLRAQRRQEQAQHDTASELLRSGQALLGRVFPDPFTSALCVEVLEGDFDLQRGLVQLLAPSRLQRQPVDVKALTLCSSSRSLSWELSLFKVSQTDPLRLTWAVPAQSEADVRWALAFLLSLLPPGPVLLLPRERFFSLPSFPEAGLRWLSRMGVYPQRNLFPDVADSLSSSAESAGVDGFFSHLDDSQRLAALRAAFPVSLIWGPPGTGKSSTLRALIRAELAAGRRVILTANSYAALDAVLSGLADLSDSAGESLFRLCSSGREVDLPGVTNLRHLKSLDLHGSWCLALVAARLSSVQSLTQVAHLLVIDEASQVAAHVLPFAAALLREDGRLLSCGDHLQLQVIRDVAPPASLDAVLGSVHDFLRSGPFPLTLLSRGYRSVKEITDLVCLAGYPELVSVRGSEPLFLSGWPEAVFEVLVHAQPSSGRICLSEAQACVWFVRQLLETSGLSPEEARGSLAGVVVVHRAQRRLIRQLFVEAGLEALVDDVDTADRFQGQEREMVIVSFGLDQLGRGFAFDPARLNVMFSRPRRRLLVLVHENLIAAAPQQLRLDGLEQTAAVVPELGQVRRFFR